MPSIHDRSARRDAEHLSDDDLVDLEPVVGGPVRPGWTGQGEETATWRSRLAVVAGFLAVFHLAFALIKFTDSAAGSGFTSDAPAWSLLVRATVAGLVFALLRSSLPLGRRGLWIVEWGLLGVEMFFVLATQYLSVIDLIDRRDLIDAVAIQKNGVIRTLVLMICFGVFVPRPPAVTARIAVTMAAAIILCHGVVLHHADTVDLDMDDVAGHQIVMANALFLIMGVLLTTLAAWVLRGHNADRRGPDRVGSYRLLRKLDDGGHGEIYLAEHDVLQRPCALKLVRSGDREAAARFEREVRAAAKLSHPNTVTMFESGHTDGGTPYCVMEYLPGLSVAEIVNQTGPLPASRAVHLGSQVCGALGEAHRQGLVHRDLSPANVFVAVLGGRCDVAKVLDFGAVGGLAAGAAHDPAAGGMVAGTPEFVSPEQAVAGRSVDGRSDIYGLGALLYFMVTGRPPFERATPDEVLRAHLGDQVIPPRQLVMEVPVDLEAVILRCLAKRPEDRYADARDVAAALDACGCAAEWDEARAEGWWLEQAAGPAAAPRGPTPSF